MFKNYPEFRGLNGLCRFLHFVPLPDEVLDFFRPVAGQIIQLLKGKAFLPTLSSGSNLEKRPHPKIRIEWLLNEQHWIKVKNITFSSSLSFIFHMYYYMYYM